MIFNLFLFSEQSVPGKHSSIPKERKNKENFKRIMCNFHKNFVPFVKSLFADTLYTFRKNAECIFIIKEHGRRKLFASSVRPAVLFFYAVTHKNKRRLCLIYCRNNITFYRFWIITDISSYNTKAWKSIAQIMFSFCKRFLV